MTWCARPCWRLSRPRAASSCTCGQSRRSRRHPSEENRRSNVTDSDLRTAREAGDSDAERDDRVRPRNMIQQFLQAEAAYEPQAVVLTNHLRLIFDTILPLKGVF